MELAPAVKYSKSVKEQVWYPEETMSGLHGDEAIFEPRYELQHCPLLGTDVWVARLRQSDGKWRMTQCFGKRDVCKGHQCPLADDKAQPEDSTKKPSTLS